MNLDPKPAGYDGSTTGQECTCMDPVSAAKNGHDPGCIYSTIQARPVEPRTQTGESCNCYTPAPLDQHLDTCPFAIWRNRSSDIEDHVLVVTEAQVAAAAMAQPINTGESPNTGVIGTEAQTTLPPGVNTPVAAEQPRGIWDQINTSVQPEAVTASDEALAQQIHRQMGLTDVVSLGFLFVSLQAAREFDQKMSSMR